MGTFPSDVAFTPAVKSVQMAKGSRAAYQRMERGRGWQTTITADLAKILSTLDMFYLGTATADGQPYIQYRGGPAGFLKSIGPGTLAFADFGGNQQYLSVGNLSENSKAFLFLMDYENQRRVKVWGTAPGRKELHLLWPKVIFTRPSARTKRASLRQAWGNPVDCVGVSESWRDRNRHQ